MKVKRSMDEENNLIVQWKLNSESLPIQPTFVDGQVFQYRYFVQVVFDNNEEIQIPIVVSKWHDEKRQ